MSQFTKVSSAEASAAKTELGERLINRFNHASFPLIGTLRTRRLSTAEWGVQIGLLREVEKHEKHELPETYKVGDVDVKISYVSEGRARKFTV